MPAPFPPLNRLWGILECIGIGPLHFFTSDLKPFTVRSAQWIDSVMWLFLRLVHYPAMIVLIHTLI